jgi:hypothetical protein
MSDDQSSFSAPRKRCASRKLGFKVLGVGNTKGHDLINRGLIRAKKLDGKTLIDLDSVDDFLASLPDARVVQPKPPSSRPP